ncbi:MAG: response regulator [Clostridia bacterium]|jgi:two-component system chemotaxis response regulator CheY|nr:response regulator [Clostridia bacterium]MDD4571916.1 response regulator [Clostridia bacterium]
MSKKIMLVDDAAFMRMMIKDTLSKNNYTDIVEAGNGQIAVDTYTAEKPDLVIMDITMPVMDGLEALRKIREIDQNANVVMCSAMGQEAMVVDALKQGAKDFIVKPFKPDRIMKTVNSILG